MGCKWFRFVSTSVSKFDVSAVIVEKHLKRKSNFSRFNSETAAVSRYDKKKQSPKNYIKNKNVGTLNHLQSGRQNKRQKASN